MAGARPRRPELGYSVVTHRASRSSASAHRGARTSSSASPTSPAPPSPSAVRRRRGRNDRDRRRAGAGRPQPGVRARGGRSPGRRSAAAAVRRQRRAPTASTVRPTRPAPSSIRRRWRARGRPGLAAPAAVSRRQQRLRVFRRAGRSHQHRSDRHERRRPPGSSGSLGIQCFLVIRFSRSCASGCITPPACASSSKCSRCRATSARRSSGTSSRSSHRATSSKFAGIASACPRRWTSTSAGCRRTRPATASSSPERPLESAGGDIYISGPHLNDAMHGDRVVVRIERIKDGGRAEGRIIRILERANESARRPLRPRRQRHGLRRAVRSARAHGHLHPARGRRAARRRRTW